MSNNYKQSNRIKTKKLQNKVQQVVDHLDLMRGNGKEDLNHIIKHSPLMNFEKNANVSRHELISSVIFRIEKLEDEWNNLSENTESTLFQLMSILTAVEKYLHEDLDKKLKKIFSNNRHKIIDIDRISRPTKHSQNTDIFAYRLKDLKKGTTFFVNAYILRNALGYNYREYLEQLFDRGILIGERGKKTKYTSKAPSYVGFKSKVYKIRQIIKH